MGGETLIGQCNECLGDRQDIPGAPLWHMGKVAVFGSQQSFDLIQNTIDYLACKGRAALAFTDREKKFMEELFEALWWGGTIRGYHEAARLADHYVNGGGRTIRINSGVYTSSVIVSEAIVALKAYIRELHGKKRSIASISTGDPGFMGSRHADALRQGRRSASRQGYMLSDGALLVEQSNLRLKNTDHRFYLRVNTTAGGGVYSSRWHVSSLYDFEPFERGYVTHIPLAENFVLKLPDGLSHHLTRIGVADEFRYTSEWRERWT